MAERFELQPELTGIALAYRNTNLIADKVLPKVSVSQASFQYRKYSRAAFLTVPNAKIGEKSIPNSIELKSQLLTESVEDYALKDEIAKAKLDEAAKNGKNANYRESAVLQLVDALKITREVELASVLADKNNYGANVKTLNTSEKISDAAVNAVDLIEDAKDKMFQKPNTMVLSRSAASKLRRNPFIVSACNHNSGKDGIVSIQAIKELFELDNIFVGEAVLNNSNKKDTVALNACFKNNIGLYYINPLATPDGGISFGYNAVLDELQVGSYFNPELGTKGCEVLKAFMSEKYLVTCPEAGYLLESVI